MPVQDRKDVMRRYNQSPKGRENKQRYNKSEKGREYQQAYYATERGKDLRRSRKLKFNYGITLQERDDMLLAQNSRCALCKTEDPGAKGWCVDHCHATNKVRGILCNSCNLMLGYSKDRAETLAAAIKYLKGN